MGTLKFTRKDGEGYKSELQECKEDMMRNNGRVDLNSSVDRLNEGTKPYDEWEAIQRELALYPESRDKDDMVGHFQALDENHKTDVYELSC